MNEEVKAIKKKAEASVASVWPKKNVDYHLIRVPALGSVPSGWIAAYQSSSNFTKTRVKHFLNRNKAGELPQRDGMQSGIFITWYMYLGPKPSKKWGQVCP